MTVKRDRTIWMITFEKIIGVFFMAITALVVIYFGSFASKAKVDDIDKKTVVNKKGIEDNKKKLQVLTAQANENKRLQCLMAIKLKVKRADLPEFCAGIVAR